MSSLDPITESMGALDVVVGTGHPRNLNLVADDSLNDCVWAGGKREMVRLQPLTCPSHAWSCREKVQGTVHAVDGVVRTLLRMLEVKRVPPDLQKVFRGKV